ncbi:PH domain-containing protein [Halostagnicola bangensis]
MGGLTLCGLAISYPRNATLEYEFYDDRLVCYDRWLQQPQWELPYAEIDQVSITHSRVGQLVGYSTVSIGTSDGMPAKLPYLSDGEEVVARLGRIAHIEVH